MALRVLNPIATLTRTLSRLNRRTTYMHYYTIVCCLLIRLIKFCCVQLVGHDLVAVQKFEGDEQQSDESTMGSQVRSSANMRSLRVWKQVTDVSYLLLMSYLGINVFCSY